MVLRFFTQLMHEGRWPCGVVVVMTSTTYNAVKHAIRCVIAPAHDSHFSKSPRFQNFLDFPFNFLFCQRVHRFIWCAVFSSPLFSPPSRTPSGADIRIIDLPFPLEAREGETSCDLIVNAFDSGNNRAFTDFPHELASHARAGIREIASQSGGKTIALAVIDHIVSTTAIVVPVQRVIAVLKKVSHTPTK